MCQGSRKRETNETQTRVKRDSPVESGTPWPFHALFSFSSHTATPRPQSMECHKYLVVALTHAIYPKLTPLLRSRRKTESHAIAKTHTTNSKSHCARLIQHILLHHQILRKAYTVLLRTTKYYTVLLRTTKCYSVLQSATPYDTVYCKVLLRTTQYYKVLPSTTPYYKVLLRTTK